MNRLLTIKEQQLIKQQFERQVDTSSREDMIDFLRNHFRYHTMNSWNASTSYANCIKVDRLRLPDGVSDVKYDMIGQPEWQQQFTDMIDYFDICNDGFAVGTNGRSSGYLVLYTMGRNKHGKMVCYSGRHLDQGEDFHEWDDEDLRERVNLIQDFDRLTSDIVIEFATFCLNYDIEEETIMVPKKIQVLKEKPDGH